MAERTEHFEKFEEIIPSDPDTDALVLDMQASAGEEPPFIPKVVAARPGENASAYSSQATIGDTVSVTKTST